MDKYRVRQGAGTRIGTKTRNDPLGQVSGHIAHEWWSKKSLFIKLPSNGFEFKWCFDMYRFCKVFCSSEAISEALPSMGRASVIIEEWEAVVFEIFPPVDEILLFGLEEPEILQATLFLGTFRPTLSGFAGCLGIEDFAGPFWISEFLVPLGVPLALDFEDVDWLIDPFKTK